MPSRFKIRFPAPLEKVAVATVVVDSDSIQEDNPDLTVPPTGPDEIESSPAIQIDTQSDSGRQPRSLSYPDVEILPIHFSTSGQEDVVHRTSRVGVTAVWNENVTGFSLADVEVTVQTEDATANASLDNFRGTDGGTSYTFQLNFPSSGSGSVTLRIPPNSANSVSTGRDGPVGSRSRTFTYDFASGVVDGDPAVEIQVPARSPYVGTSAPIRFLWNVPVVGFSASDVTLVPSTITMTEPTLTSNPLLWEAELSLPAVTADTIATVTVAADSVDSQSGVSGPESNIAEMFTFNSPASTAIGGIPAGCTAICDTTAEVDSLNYLSNIGISGGAVYGITDLTKIGDNLFGIAQVRKRREGRTNELADTLVAGAALFRVNLDTNACTILKAYPNVLEAARSLTSHGGALNWIEGTGYLYRMGFGSNPAQLPVNNPRVGNLGRYDIAGNCVSTLGKVWRIALGRQQGTAFQKDFGVCGGTYSPLISADGKLLCLPGTGNTDFIGYAVNRRYLFQKRDSEPSPPSDLTYDVDTDTIGNLGDWSLSQPPNDTNLFGLFEDNVYIQVIEIDARATPPRVLLVGDVEEIDSSDFTAPGASLGIPTAETGDALSAVVDNWSLVSYSASIEPRLQQVTTNGLSPWDFLLDIARMTLTILAFQDGLLFMKPRLPVRGVLTSALSNTADSLDFRYTSVNRPFPSTGTLVCEDEAIAYSSVGTASLGALVRARNGTAAAAHASGTQMVLVDHVLNETAFATDLEEVSIDTDGHNLYNSIQVRYANDDRVHTERDSASIAIHGEREFVVNAPFLSRHQSEWARWSAEHTLDTFKELQHVIRMTLRPRFDIEIGDYVFLNVPRDEIRRVGLVTRVLYSSGRELVEVDLRTITFP